MPVRITEDGAYDLRGASEEEVGEAIDDYFAKTPPDKNVFLMEEQKGVIGRLRERLGDLWEDVSLPIRDILGF